jgi:CHAD domain-containing protein
MRGELQKIQKLAAPLRENLVKCADDPDVDPVHDTRTGTRRLQATLEELLRATPDDEETQQVRAAATALMRQLKKIRRAAAPVRDLDVHRKLLDKLTKHALGEKTKKEQSEESPGSRASAIVDQPDLLERPEAGLRTTPLEQQSDDLDGWLKHHRAQQAHALQSQARSLATKLEKRLENLATAMRAAPRRRAAKPPGIVALDAFARLASEMQHLDAGNLHDFRKGAKKARYVAELAAQGDKHADAIAKTLKKLQDEIGDWHDWLVLAEEAHTALGEGAADLTRLIEGECEKHFVAAMKTAAKLRGRLMGEWLAASRNPASPARSVHRQRPSLRTAAG